MKNRPSNIKLLFSTRQGIELKLLDQTSKFTLYVVLLLNSHNTYAQNAIFENIDTENIEASIPQKPDEVTSTSNMFGVTNKLLLVADSENTNLTESNKAIKQDNVLQQKPITIDFNEIKVRAKRFHEIGPLPGLGLTKEEIPGNVQSVTAKEIRESHSVSLPDLLNKKLQSVNVNDYQGNPFMMDVTYRGFTAGPQIGTPQGLSVFFDGIRVNEPFGDVVNWDLIPMNAIASVDVFPGSNPIFGLNTLGGALSVRTKSGFDGDEGSIEVLGGSFNRKQFQGSVSGNNGVIAGFAAANIFKEDGWRDNSPSKVNQLFGKVEWRNEKVQLGLSTLYAGNDLIGNGLIPKELNDERPETVFTSPDQTKNRLLQFQLSGAFDVSDTFNITSQVYRRNSKRNSVNGDVYVDFDEMDSRNDTVLINPTIVNSLPLCKFQDIDRNGKADYFVDFDADGVFNQNIDGFNIPITEEITNTYNVVQLSLNGVPNVDCDPFAYFSGTVKHRNGKGDGLTLQDGTGVIEGTPIGMLSKTKIDQIVKGGAVQFNWNLDQHKFMVGTSIDIAKADYLSVSRLALIDASHNVYLDPANITPLYYAGANDVTNNAFDGKSTTTSAYFSETYSPLDNLHFSLATRYNHTKVKNNLKSRLAAVRSSLHNLHGKFTFLNDTILCPSTDLASCPDTPNASTASTGNIGDNIVIGGEVEEYTYNSLNPSLGVSFLPKKNLNLYANWNQGTRTPSVVELGCALDKTMVHLGDETSPLVPRSLVQSGGACTLPTSLSGDPYLPQIKAHTHEIGARGQFANGWNWNISAYRTDLKHDIYFVGVTDSRSFFDDIGDTMRKGIEFGFSGNHGPFDFSVNYSLTKATFESPFWISNQRNSSADFDINGGVQPGIVPLTQEFIDNFNNTIKPNADHLTKYGISTYHMIKVKPGDTMPGVPLHNFNINLGYKVTERLKLGLNMVAHSSAFARGNENNKHRAGPAAYEAPGVYKNIIFDDITGEPIAGEYVAVDPYRAGQPFSQSGKTPGYAVFNFDASYELDKGLILGLQIKNLFDRKYYTASRLGANPFSPSIKGDIGPSGWNYNSKDWQNTNFVAPGAPRSAWVNLTYEF